MEMHERIKELRKKYLKMTQEEFGQRLGVTRDTIGNIELNRLARPDQKLSLIKLMCKEFNVREEWILNGTEPMLVQPDTFSLDSFVKERGMSDLELRILKRYFALDPKIRQDALSYFLSDLEAEDVTVGISNPSPASAEYPKQSTEFEKKFPPLDMSKDAI